MLCSTVLGMMAFAPILMPRTTCARTNLLNFPTLCVLQSKWSPEELEARGGMVTAMHSQLQELKETSLKGYVRNYQQNRAVAMVAMQDSEAFRGQLGEPLAYYDKMFGCSRKGGRTEGPGGVASRGHITLRSGCFVTTIVKVYRCVPGCCANTGSMPANTSMTAEQSIQLQQLKDRDKDMVGSSYAHTNIAFELMLIM